MKLLSENYILKRWTRKSRTGVVKYAHGSKTVCSGSEVGGSRFRKLLNLNWPGKGLGGFGGGSEPPVFGQN